MTAEIQKLMDTLHLTEAEALELANADREVDRMTLKEVNADLTDEQKAISKKARQSDRKVATEKPKREKKTNDAKRHLIGCFKTLLEGLGCEVNILNAEREIEFYFNGVKYKIVLSQPRT